MKKTILYYTNNMIDGTPLNRRVLSTLTRSGLAIVSVSQHPMGLGRNIVADGGYSAGSIIAQIITGLEVIGEGVVYFAEHDVLYDRSHWRLEPGEKPIAYNTHYYRLYKRYYTRRPKHRVVLSMLIGDCRTLLAHFTTLTETPSVLEPGRGTTDIELLASETPCVDVRHPFCLNRGVSSGQRRSVLSGYGHARDLRKALGIGGDFVW